MNKLIWLVLPMLMMGCSGGRPAPVATWSISIDTTEIGSALNPALLGHYDLSGVLYDYTGISGL